MSRHLGLSRRWVAAGTLLPMRKDFKRQQEEIRADTFFFDTRHKKENIISPF